ncbi:MAG: type II secretion system F family protein [Candidatus Xenobiia bacterium LiM19]
MAQYLFIAQDQLGKRLSGRLDASDRESAIKSLSDKNLIVTKLDTVKERGGFLGLFSAVRQEEVLLFTQELGAMLDAGIGIVQAMNTIAADIENLRFRGMVAEMANGIAGGKQLSEVLQRHERIFSKLYISMVRAGETSGNLPAILIRLAGYIENAETLRKKIQSALYYPATVVVFAVAVVTFIFVFGVPRLSSIYKGFDTELPFFTRLILGLGTFLGNNIIIIALLLITGGYFLLRFFNTEKGHLFWDAIKLNAPIMGHLFQKLAIARFASTLGTLYGSGVPILKSLQIVAGATGNKVVENTILKALKSVKEGESIVEPLRKSEVFTNLAISMIAVGEESGTLEAMLNRVASFYETQVDIILKGLAGLLEPIILIFIGLMIAVVILALGLPFMTLSTLLR